ncbi:MAG: hypothetical protein FGF51_04570 [Candidatus Brockarchaeota archaeon]|nr:hypothetical protein [Candidatus Brockarchaeota archaeon]
MVKGWLPLLAFVGGLYLGGEIKAKEVEVPPNIVFAPLEEFQLDEKSFNVEDIVREVAREMWGFDLKEEQVKELTEKFKEVDPGLEKMIKTYKIQSYLNKLEKIAVAFNEGKIDVATYLFLTESYVRKIQNLVM